MKIISAEFLKSAVKPGQFPEDRLPEIAFAGRSNSGKSSLINTLLNRKRLVKTSSTPGCTQLINFFMINQRFLMVDLPGYGYAKVPKRLRERWKPMVEGYLKGRENLKGVVLIMDVRRTPGIEELDLISWLKNLGIPSIPVLTKADKLSRSKQQKQLNKVQEAFGALTFQPVVFSSKTRQGKDALWQELMSLDSGITG